MGTVKYRNAVIALVRKTPVVTVDSIRKIAGEMYVHLLLHTMVKKGELHRITKGCYSHIDDPALAVFCFQPAYLGLQDALSIHNIWEQETNPVILTTKKVREGTREILHTNVLLRHIPVKYYFGFEYVQYGEAHIPVSDIEKTLLDMVHFKQPLDKGILRTMREHIDKRKLQQYLKMYEPEFTPLFLKKTGLGKLP
ncbi:hypothetical protein HYY72_01875 [Candidatus Woesearchaeota archaeon]|nr:hypothetical protein [Candidatus Woesearchaeota archaeon]